MSVSISPSPRQQYFDSNGNPCIGWKLFTYAAGSTTKQTTYTDSTGATPNTNPIILNAEGRTPWGVWYTDGLLYKEILATPTDTDPPTGGTLLGDNLSGSTSANATISEWKASNLTPTFISATSFSLLGDQTSLFEVGRRVKTTNSGGTIYSIIESSTFGAGITTIVVTNDSGVIDSGLTAVSYGILSSINQSIPNIKYLPSGTGAIQRTIQGKLRQIIDPKDFGAVGDGVNDDGVALNLALAAVRAALTYDHGVILDLANGLYRTTISLNVTAMSSYSWGIRNGTIVGECTGKAVLDCVGSRWGYLSNIVIIGSPTSIPSVGIQCAPSASGAGGTGFCDMWLWDHVMTDGYFSLTAIYTYGQETTHYNHCRFWNSHRDGMCGVHIGTNIFAITSDYLAPTTGAVSHSNSKFTNCDYRGGGMKSKVITGITKANPAVVTAVAHPFVNGDVITIVGVVGMTEVNNKKFTVANKTADTFQLSGINSTAYTTYTSGGSAIEASTAPTIYMSRMQQFSFDSCYCVNWGSDSIILDYGDGTAMTNVNLDFSFEGSGIRSNVRFKTGTNTLLFRGGSIKAFKSCAMTTFISTDASGAGRVSFKGAEIKVTTFFYAATHLFDAYASYLFSGGAIYYPQTAFVTLGSFASFQGDFFFYDSLEGSIADSVIIAQANAYAFDATSLVLGKEFSATVGAAGGAAALPATPSGYLSIYLGANKWKIPLFLP